MAELASGKRCNCVICALQSSQKSLQIESVRGNAQGEYFQKIDRYRGGGGGLPGHGRLETFPLAEKSQNSLKTFKM